MSKLVEAMARAMCVEQGAWDPDYETSGLIAWQLYAREAVAALRAMAEVEPSKEVIAACSGACSWFEGESGEYTQYLDDKKAKEVFLAGLRQAVAEAQESGE